MRNLSTRREGSHLLLFTLIIFHASCAIVVKSTATTGPIADFFASGLVRSQISLLGCWGVIGTGSFALRLSCMMIGAICLWGLETSIVGAYQFATAIEILLAMYVAYKVTALLQHEPLRFASIVVRRFCRQDLRFGFSLRDALIFVGIVAAILGIYISTPLYGAASLVRFCAEMAISTALAVVIVFRIKTLSKKCIGAAIAIFWEPTIQLAVCGSGSIEDWVLLSSMVVSQNVFLLASLYVLKCCGYQLAGKKKGAW